MVEPSGTARSRRDNGRNDRKFLEAQQYFAVHNSIWRALPAESSRPSFPKVLDTGRSRAEQGVGKLERLKRIALRSKKTAQNFAAFLSIACTLILVKPPTRLSATVAAGR